MSDVIDNYSLRVRGQEELRRLQEEIDAAARSLTDLSQGTAQFDAILARNVPRINELQGQLRRLNTRGASQGMIEVSRAMDDVQYGIQGVMNNVQQMAFMMGASGGLVLAITGVTVAANQLVKHWEKVRDVLKSVFLGGEDANRYREAIEKIEADRKSVV